VAHQALRLLLSWQKNDLVEEIQLSLTINVDLLLLSHLFPLSTERLDASMFNSTRSFDLFVE
jgi:hypothetical protein